MKERSLVALLAVVVLLCVASGLNAAETGENDLDFLVGFWSGSGSGNPGTGSGSFSFTRELGDRILTRRAHSEYPATEGRPAVTHDDLLIVYSEGSKAIYFDNEGHVIHYEVQVTPNPRTATFLSSDPPPSPRFRLTYTQVAGNGLEILFEISPTGDLGDFKTYLEGTVTKQTGGAR